MLHQQSLTTEEICLHSLIYKIYECSIQNILCECLFRRGSRFLTKKELAVGNNVGATRYSMRVTYLMRTLFTTSFKMSACFRNKYILKNWEFDITSKILVYCTVCIMYSRVECEIFFLSDRTGQLTKGKA